MNDKTCCEPSCCSTEPTDALEAQAKDDAIRQQIREDYAKVANTSDTSSGCGIESSCCGYPMTLKSIA